MLSFIIGAKLFNFKTMHLPHLIIDLALILASAAVISLVFKKLKQPVVLGYIIAGIFVGPHFDFFPNVLETDSIKIWAEIGVIILLFNLGLEFSFKKLVKEGFRVVVIALFGVLLTLFSGFILGKLLGWSNMDSLFMGGILSIASTTIIIRAFEELGVKTQKFTNIVTSVLVVEDLVAVVLMVILSTISISREFQGTELLMSVFKLLFFLVLWFVSGIFFLPTILKFLKRLLNEETLLIFSLALCFMVVILALKAGFSPAFGAFIMGSILAETTKAERIEHLIAPLKNLFGAIFFVSVGMLLNPAMIIEHIGPVIGATLILLIGKPLFITAGSLITGQPVKIAFQSGLSLSQIGEFSFIIATLGLSLNVTSDFLYPIAVAVSVITTFTTPYMIKLAEPLYGYYERRAPVKWKNFLLQHSMSTEKLTELSEWRSLLRKTLFNTLIYSVIIITIIFVNVKVVQPYFWHYKWSRVIVAGLTIAMLSPFLWALSFRKSDKVIYARLMANPLHRSSLIMLGLGKMALTIFYVGFVFEKLFSTQTALIGVGVTIGLMLLFSKHIQRFYGKIEFRFLSNLHEREKSFTVKSNDITPWDTHLSTIQLSAHCPFIGKTLLESRIREDFGVNIAAIERDDIKINVPDRFERLYPHDVISVIGTDEQLTKFREFVEQTRAEADILKAKDDMKLLHFEIRSSSELIGRSIKSSNIRELTKGLVVGVERTGNRILNPESNFVFKEGDVVWVVGNQKRIRVLAGDAKQYKE